MNDFLTGLASLSLGGAIVIVLIAITAHCSRSRYGARWRCWVWLVLCIRLAIPILLFPGRQAPPIRIRVPEHVTIPIPEAVEAISPGLVQGPIDQLEPGGSAVEEAGKSGPPTLFHLFGMVWMIGALCTALWAIWSHFRFLSYIRRWGRSATEPQIVQCFNEAGNRLALRHTPSMKRCKGVKAPMLAGVFHPILLLPEELLVERELRYVLLHELTHFKRHDIWLKGLCLLVRSIHWFNPAVWYMVHLIERDTELGCDEDALRHLDPQEHAAYGETILHAVERLNTVS